jgi:hypothetical protein
MEVFQRYVNGRFGVNDYIICKNSDISLETETKTKKIAYGIKDENGKFHPENIIAYTKNGVKKAVKGVAEKVKKVQLQVADKIKKTVQVKQSFFAGMNTSKSDKIAQIRENIDLEGLIKMHTVLKHGNYVYLLDTGFKTICECLKQDKVFKIGGEFVDASRVHEAMMSLDCNAFEGVMLAVDKKITNGEAIHNLKSYLITSFYNSATNVNLIRQNC